jgi:glycosyltransferase involved in cell wall biosynthesis
MRSDLDPGNLEREPVGENDSGRSDRAVSKDGCITILMPVKNYHPRYLQEALQSIFLQTSAGWRVYVIVEREDLAHLQAVLGPLPDLRVSLIVNQGHKLAGAFNTGMRAASTEFVATLLADDRWAPGAVEVLQRCISAYPEADFFHSGLQIIDENGNAISPVRQPPQELSIADFIEGSAAKHLLCWRRSRAMAIGGMDESLKGVGPDDYDFPWTMFERGARFHAVDECLYQYRDHRDTYRLTTHLPRSIHLKELRRILVKHHVAKPQINQHLSRAKRLFLRQCLYRNRFDRWLKEKILGLNPAKGWRERYEGWDAPKSAVESHTGPSSTRKL